MVRKFDLGGTLPGLGFSSISTLTLFGGTGGGADGAVLLLRLQLLLGLREHRRRRRPGVLGRPREM